MLKTASPAPAQYVDTPQRLNDFLRAVDESPVIAIDTEFVREKTYYPQLCLIQVAAENSIWLIDTLVIEDLSSFFQALCNPPSLKVFHAARQDLEIFFNETGRIPSPLFDTQIAAALLGRPDQIAYAGLVAEFYAIELDKSSSRTNWARRPLSASQIEYAAADVRYLAGVKTKLEDELIAKGRSEWLAEECLRLGETELYDNNPSAVWRRVKGIAKLEPDRLGIAATLAAWREMNAQQRNLPRGWVLKDDRLLAIARAAPNSTAQLHAIDGLAPGLLRRHGSELLQAIQAPATQLTGANDMHLPRLTGAGKLLLQNLLVALRHCSETNLVSSSLIATRRELESAICGRTAIRLYEGWRNNLFGYSVREAIAAHAASKLYE